MLQRRALANEGLSDAFKASVAERYNVPIPPVKTGGTALDARNEDGSPRYTPDNPVDLGDGTAGYEYPNGDRAVRVIVNGRGLG